MYMNVYWRDDESLRFFLVWVDLLKTRSIRRRRRRSQARTKNGFTCPMSESKLAHLSFQWMALESYLKIRASTISHFAPLTRSSLSSSDRCWFFFSSLVCDRHGKPIIVFLFMIDVLSWVSLCARMVQALNSFKAFSSLNHCRLFIHIHRRYVAY